MNTSFVNRISAELEEVKTAGLFKNERGITSGQGAENLVNGKAGLNFCANNYLGLSSHPKVLEAAKKTIDKRGYGMSSVRFICGTQDIHKELEDKISKFLGTEDTILYAAAFDANGGVFEPLFNEEDAIISDALNHASIIDGIRLCKAQRFRYEHNNMADLEEKLKESSGLRSRIIVTDGSFSMDGTIAQLDKICDLADKYDAIVMIDECHSSGFLGKTGRGTHEYRNVMGRIDIITGTLGKALGGGLPMGAFVSSKDRMSLFTDDPGLGHITTFGGHPLPCVAGLAALEVLENEGLAAHAERMGHLFKELLVHPLIREVRGKGLMLAVDLGDAELVQRVIRNCLENGVLGFWFLSCPTAFRIAPPLPIAEHEVRLACATVIACLKGKP